MDERSQILITDDDPDIRKVLYLLLRDHYSVAEASNGAEAVAYMRAHPDTDLVVLDVMMPGMDGFEACDAIRAFSNVPILFLTAKSAEADRISAYGSGGDDFLSKPFSQDELLAKVTSLLRRYKEYRGKTVTAADMYEAVWNERFLSGSGNTVMVHVLNLRRKIEEDPSNPRIIRTVWGKGYQID